jgi:hypothetical protein
MDPTGTTPARRLRVGVTINIRDSNQSLWENGIFQNCILLVKLFKLLPEVESAVLIHGAGVKQIPEGLMLSEMGVEIIGSEKAIEELDVVVEMSDQLPEDWVTSFRAKGGRYIAMKVGNEYFIDVERPVYNLPHAGLCSDKVYDAVWTLPQYEDCCADYFSLNMRAPVRILPHLWSPIFMEKSLSKLPEGVHFGYKPGRRRWRVCTFEPNLSMVKTSITPMLVCEEAYRTNSRFAQIFRFCNTYKAKDNPAFVRFARSLDIVKNGLSSFDARLHYYEFMAKDGDCVVSHQWHNAQNYIYYETLYGGYPLIHNSPLLRDIGYFYPDFDCQKGGKVLLGAYEGHDAGLDLYKERAANFLKTLDISYPPNLEAYSRELKRLFEPTETGPDSAVDQKKS